MTFELELFGWELREYKSNEQIKLYGELNGTPHVALLYCPRNIKVFSLEWVVWKTKLIRLTDDKVIQEREAESFEDARHNLQQLLKQNPIGT